MGVTPLRAPRHRGHGGPLPRRQANVPRANPDPTNLYLPGDVPGEDHGKLVRISPGYVPDPGMLLTCYAPFRRSPPECCHPALPLGLHVLGLPLAFILSQDQTLHCIITHIILSPSCTLRSSYLLIRNCACSCYIAKLSFTIFPCTASPLSSSGPVLLLHHVNELSPFPNGIAKVHLFSYLANFFSFIFATASRANARNALTGLICNTIAGEKIFYGN